MILTQIGTIASSIQNQLLLDLYINAQAAFSLRKLRTTYLGSCIRVLRSSDSTEQDIGFTNNILDTASLLNFCGAGNGYITKWYDQSGNGFDLSQNTINKWPQIVSSGIINTQNGKNSINWVVSPSAFLKGSTAANWAFLNNSSGFSIYIALNIIGGNSLMGTNTVGTSGVVGYFLDRPNANDCRSVITNGSSIVSNNGSTGDIVPENSLILLSDLGDPSNATAANRDEIYINGGSAIKNNVANAAPSASSPANPLQLGGYGDGVSGSFNGYISELIFYPIKQTTNNTAIKNNINAFYTIY